MSGKNPNYVYTFGKKYSIIIILASIFLTINHGHGRLLLNIIDKLLFLLLLLHLVMHPTNVTQTQKLVCPSEKKNCWKCAVRVQVFRKNLRTNCQISRFNKQLMPTDGSCISQRLSNLNPSCGEAQQDPREQRSSKPTYQCKNQQGNTQQRCTMAMIGSIFIFQITVLLSQALSIASPLRFQSIRRDLRSCSRGF